MKTSRICLFVFTFFLVVSSLQLMSCEPEIITISSTQNQGIGTAGDFQVSNMSNKDTLLIDGAIEFKIDGNTKVLNAKNGDSIKLKFVPKEEYAKYVFNTTYKLNDGTEITPIDNYEYEFTISNFEAKDYLIKLSAIHNENDGVQLTAVGVFTLRVKE